MEFIPIEKYSDKKGKGKRTAKRQKDADEPEEKLNKKETKKSLKDVSLRKIKPKPHAKKVKNQFRERLMNKKKQNVSKKDKRKKKEEDDEEEDEDFQDVDEEKMEETVDDEGEEEGEEEEEGDEEDEEGDEDEEDSGKALEEKIKKRRQELDEKKKNRLFIKLKKKILNEAQIKQLHPDIRSVIYPRKKRSRWCWAVFASEERADEALKKLMKNKEIVAAKPNPHEKVEMKQEKKMKTVQRKKEASIKLKKIWM